MQQATRLVALALGAATLALVAIIVTRWPHGAGSAARVTPEPAAPARGLRARAALQSPPARPGGPALATPAAAPAPGSADIQARPTSDGPLEASALAAAPEAPPTAALAAEPARSDDDQRRHEEVMAAIAARERARAQSSLSIQMYSTSWCGACKAARLYMQGHGIAFVDHDVEAEPDAKVTQLALNPRGSVPTIDVDGKEVLVGWNEGALTAAIARAAAARDGS